jgi:uncharacterized surface protein with fasciclin (FAS1) repeats
LIVKAAPGRGPVRTHDKDEEDDMFKQTFAAMTLGTLVMGLAVSTPARAAEGDIVETAVAAGSFTTLARALQAADLVDTLKGAGPFTVFAPTDEAFAKLPAGTLESLLRPENKEKLQRILTYHVVPGKVMAAQVTQMQSATAVSGDTITVRASNGMVRVNDAHVTAADVAATNGVIHVIDSVILPEGL